MANMFKFNLEIACMHEYGTVYVCAWKSPYAAVTTFICQFMAG